MYNAAILLSAGIVVVGIWTLYKKAIVKSMVKTLPSLTPASWFYGNMQQLLGYEAGPLHDNIVCMGSVVKVHGLMGDEQLYVSDTRALYHILVKDQDLFEESLGVVESSRLFYGQGLIGSVGEQHKRQRKLLNPVFSTSNLRQMKPVFSQVTEQLRAGITKLVQNGETVVDVLDWSSRSALEYIGVGGLGHSFGALGENADNVYSHAAESLLPNAFPYFPLIQFLPALTTPLPAKIRRWIVELLPIREVQELKYVIDTMEKTSVDIYRKRKRALLSGDGDMKETLTNGKDILSILSGWRCSRPVSWLKPSENNGF
ncbi:cytochrome P450 [Punctularia strigosozonata HHB-11173 SS5]|uniref:cytochrome P450 n=1 Tax=Punctularia strigosozonata (strain HHB-11173) TaxID=741275 RepID=UPI0004416771|nr:cytochrome P450 [Punctularia strigosozonata HHB-11173 SS5]EIN05324.1 cytochrome P450 [Punctularia strigosozonata HHB-11173 SS5]